MISLAMASISDQIDHFTRNTRSIKAAAFTTANPATTLHIFTRAMLYTDLGDLITDIDPCEIGLFTLVQDSSTNPQDKDRSTTDPQLTRTRFSAATPLRRRPARQDPPQELEPEVYARAVLKYIDQ